MPGKRTKTVILLALLVGGFSSAAADVLILRSTGPTAKRYPAGQKVPDTFTFTLRPGDSVTVLGRAGTRLFKGPGSYAAARPPKIEQLAAGETRTGVGSLRGAEAIRPGRPGRSAGAAPRRSARTSTGAVRGVGTPALARPTDVWLADLTRGGRVCVRTGEPLTLWRPDRAKAAPVTITARDGSVRSFEWAAGQQTLRLPPDLPTQSGITYDVTRGDAQSSTRLTIVGVPADLKDREAVAATLLAERCGAQLDVFITTNVDPEDPGALEPAAPSPGNR